MTYWEAIFCLHSHHRLSGKRAPQWKANTAARYVYHVLALFFLSYLSFLSVRLADVATGLHAEGYKLMYALLPVILPLDFIFRLTFNRNQLLTLRPYLLLPFSKYACTDYMVLRQLLLPYNLIWLFFFVPFGLKTVVTIQGIGFMTGFCAGLILIIVQNGLFFQLVRTLTTHHILYWGLPILIYILCISPALATNSIEEYVNLYGLIGYRMSTFSPPAYGIALAMTATLVLVNRQLLYLLAHQEQYNAAKTARQQRAFSLSFLEYGNGIGEFLKLEVRSIFRNRNIRRPLLSSTLVVVIYSGLISLNAASVGTGKPFFLIYSFTIYAISILSRIMCYEGNFIECLMMQKDSIFQLLLAKYYIYTALQLLPFLLLLPTVALGKVSFLTLAAYLIFSVGAEYCLFFTMAIFNKVAIPLNTLHTGKARTDSLYIHIILSVAALVLPIPFLMAGDWTGMPMFADISMMVIGSCFMLTHRCWLSWISHAMSKRKHSQLEGFRKTRQPL